MGSTGYLSCGLCHQCGKCYPRASVCASCGASIDLDDAACARCGEPITDAMREAARAAFMERKRVEAEKLFANKRAVPSRPGSGFPKGPSGFAPKGPSDFVG